MLELLDQLYELNNQGEGYKSIGKWFCITEEVSGKDAEIPNELIRKHGVAIAIEEHPFFPKTCASPHFFAFHFLLELTVNERLGTPAENCEKMQNILVKIVEEWSS